MSTLDLTLLGLKLAHISAVLIWIAGLFYVAALLLAHKPAHGDQVEFVRIRHTSRFAFTAVVSPAAVAAIGTGAALLFVADALHGWMFAKLAVVFALAIAHLQFGSLLRRGAEQSYRPSPFRVFLISAIASGASMLVLWLVLAEPSVSLSWLPDWVLRPGGLGERSNIPTPI